jgi:hypothetical protein
MTLMRICRGGLFLFVSAVAQAGALQTISLSVHAQDVVWDSTRSVFFVSVAANDPQWPSSVVMVDPETGQVSDSIATNDEPDHLAISSDGQYLYVGIDSKGVMRRYHLPSHYPDFDASLGSSYGLPNTALAIAPLAGQSGSILVARISAGAGLEFVVYDGATPRGSSALVGGNGSSSRGISVYARASNGQTYGYDGQRIYWLTLNATGVSISREAYAFPESEHTGELDRQQGYRRLRIHL